VALVNFSGKPGNEIVHVLYFIFGWRHHCGFVIRIVRERVLLFSSVACFLLLLLLLQLQVIFTDGVTYNDLSAASWVDMAKLLSFSSSVPSAATVSTTGLVSLINNYYTAVVITATSNICSGKSSQTSTLSLACNLANSADGDMDLGASTGWIWLI
jgi:hypothetical protein